MKKYYDIWQHKELKYIYESLLGYDNFQTTSYNDDYIYLTTILGDSPKKSIADYYDCNYRKLSTFVNLDASWIHNINTLSFDDLKKIWIKQARTDFPSLSLMESLSFFKYLFNETNSFKDGLSLKVSLKNLNLTKDILSKINEDTLTMNQKFLPVKPDSPGYLAGDICFDYYRDQEDEKLGDFFYQVLQYVKPKNKSIVFRLLNDYYNLVEATHSILPYKEDQDTKNILENIKFNCSHQHFLLEIKKYVKLTQQDQIENQLISIINLVENRKAIVV